MRLLLRVVFAAQLCEEHAYNIPVTRPPQIVRGVHLSCRDFRTAHRDHRTACVEREGVDDGVHQEIKMRLQPCTPLTRRCCRGARENNDNHFGEVAAHQGVVARSSQARTVSPQHSHARMR